MDSLETSKYKLKLSCRLMASSISLTQKAKSIKSLNNLEIPSKRGNLLFLKLKESRGRTSEDGKHSLSKTTHTILLCRSFHFLSEMQKTRISSRRTFTKSMCISWTSLISLNKSRSWMNYSKKG